MVERQTGVQFSYDDRLAGTNVSANFENESLDDGIRRISGQFNHAVIYTGTGHVKTVLVLNRRRALSKKQENPTEGLASMKEIDRDNILQQVEPPLDDISGTHSVQARARMFSAQIPMTGPSGQDRPPGTNENMNIPPGEEARSPTVNPNVSSPPGAEPLSPVVDPDVAPPPGEYPLEQENMDMISSSNGIEDAPSSN